MGVQEIDLLAVKLQSDGKVECRHIEVQASMRPISYISRVPKEVQKAGRAANSAKRSDEELNQGIAEWVKKKFRRPDKKTLMAKLWKGDWSSELVVNVVEVRARAENHRGPWNQNSPTERNCFRPRQ